MCIFFVNVLLRNENTEKIQVKKMINDPLKIDVFLLLINAF